MNLPSLLKPFRSELVELAIHTYPDPILGKKAKPINSIDEKIQVLVRNMLYTMYLAPGIGLAAPQVGQSLSLIVMDIDYEREKATSADGEITYKLSEFNPLILINPEIISKEGEFIYEEGCLSLPGIFEEVKRSQKIVVTYLDLQGKKQTLEAEDLLAVCIQHECDHLAGMVFIDRLSFLKKNFFKKKLEKEKKLAGA